MNKAHVEKKPILFNGVKVGEAMAVRYGPEQVTLGDCHWEGCAALAVHQTLLGHQLCDQHMAEFYFG